jgi:hypothetical protein
MDQHSDAPPADTTYSPRLPVNDGKMRCAGRHLFFVRYDSVDKDRNNDLSPGISFLSTLDERHLLCCWFYAACHLCRQQLPPTYSHEPLRTRVLRQFVPLCWTSLSLLRHYDISPNLRPSVVRIVIHLPLKFARHESSVHLLQTANAKDGSAFGCTPCRTYSPRLPVNDGTVRCARKRSVSFCSV